MISTDREHVPSKRDRYPLGSEVLSQLLTPEKTSEESER